MSYYHILNHAMSDSVPMNMQCCAGTVSTYAVQILQILKITRSHYDINELNNFALMNFCIEPEIPVP